MRSAFSCRILAAVHIAPAFRRGATREQWISVFAYVRTMLKDLGGPTQYFRAAPKYHGGATWHHIAPPQH